MTALRRGQTVLRAEMRLLRLSPLKLMMFPREIFPSAKPFRTRIGFVPCPAQPAARFDSLRPLSGRRAWMARYPAAIVFLKSFLMRVVDILIFKILRSQCPLEGCSM